MGERDASGRERDDGGTPTTGGRGGVELDGGGVEGREGDGELFEVPAGGGRGEHGWGRGGERVG